MELYSAIWIVLLIFALIKPKNANIYFALIFFLVLLSGLRDENIGTDTPTYRLIFEWISNESAKYIEPGWYYLNRMVFLIGGDFTFLLTLASLLTFIPLIYLSSHYKKYRYEILFFYYSMYLYLNSFNGIRQYLAVSFGLITFELMRLSEKKWKIIVSILLATMFHYTGVILFFVFVVSKIDFNKNKCIIILAVSFFIGCVGNLSFFEFFAGRYSSYLTREEYGFRQSTAGIYILTLMMNILFLFVLNFRNSKFEEYWLKLFFIGIVFLNMTFRIGLAARLILYFTVAQIIVFSLFLHCNKVKSKFIVYSVVLLYFSLLFYRNFFGGASGGDIVPYKSALF